MNLNLLSNGNFSVETGRRLLLTRQLSAAEKGQMSAVT